MSISTHLLANKELNVSVESDQKKYRIMLDGGPAKDSNSGEVMAFSDEKEARDFANTQFIRPFVKEKLAEFFSADHPMFLTGAGSSISDNPSAPEGLSMTQMWETAEKEIPNFNEFAAKIGVTKKMGIEKLLSVAQVKYEFKIGNVSLEEIKAIEEHIVSKCKLKLLDNSVHENFLSKLSNRHAYKPRISVFTLNYDDLFEQAARKTGATFLDGFSFSLPRQFHSNNFNLDIVYRENSRIKNEGNYLRNIIKFFKLHGSIDWFEQDGNTVQLPSDSSGDRRLIFPRDTKYEQTYHQPFFEMMARFQQILRKDNNYLIIIGYSFQDGHINSVIKEAIITNPTLQLLIVNPRIVHDDNFRKYLYDKTKSTSRITIISGTFADLVNTMQDRMYFSPEDIENLTK